MPLSKKELQEAKDLQKAKDKFLERPRSAHALYDSYISSVSRGRGAPIFRSYLRRQEFQSRARDLLQEISCRYCDRAINVADVDCEHINNIEELRLRLSNEFADILNNDCLRFGRAQKMLNLYLKHLWVRGLIDAPPHCPFDWIVIDKIMATWFSQNKKNVIKNALRNVKWTKLDWIADRVADKDNELGYCSLVKYARQCKGTEYPTLAEWELIKYNEYQANKKVKKRHRHC